MAGMQARWMRPSMRMLMTARSSSKRFGSPSARCPTVKGVFRPRVRLWAPRSEARRPQHRAMRNRPTPIIFRHSAARRSRPKCKRTRPILQSSRPMAAIRGDRIGGQIFLVVCQQIVCTIVRPNHNSPELRCSRPPSNPRPLDSQRHFAKPLAAKSTPSFAGPFPKTTDSSTQDRAKSKNHKPHSKKPGQKTRANAIPASSSDPKERIGSPLTAKPQ